MATEILARGFMTLTDVSDGYTLSLTSPSVSITSDYDGKNADLINAQTYVSLKHGAEDIQFVVTGVTKSNSAIQCSFVQSPAPSTPNLSTPALKWLIKLTSIPTSVTSGYVSINVRAIDGYASSINFSFSVARDVKNIRWISEWNGTATEIGKDYVVTPKIFAGTKNTEGVLNGIYLGSLTSMPSTSGYPFAPTSLYGFYGFKDGKVAFFIDKNGSRIGGWDVLPSGIYNTTRTMSIESSGAITAKTTGGIVLWSLKSDGSASFSQGNVILNKDGSASFKGKITSSSGKIGNWNIYGSQLSSNKTVLSADENVVGICTGGINHNPTNGEISAYESITLYGGIMMYYKSNADCGFVGYTGNKKVFSIGVSTNTIAGWNFDADSIWNGVKNNTSRAFTTSGITIGTNGLRGVKWRIDSDGSMALMNGKVIFNPSSNLAEIVGWQLNDKRLSSKNIAILSDSTSAGIYMSTNENANFNTIATSNLASFVESNGGLYMKIDGNNSTFAAYRILKPGETGNHQLFRLSSVGVSKIACWNFDKDALYTGTGAIQNGFTTKSGEMWIGHNGIRGFKWRLENSGAGALAGGNIAWDHNGNVTLSPSVKIAWSNLGGTIVDSNGIFAGKISANNITAGTIKTASIQSGQSTPMWALNIDGTGWLANKNITWDAAGNLKMTGEITANKGSIGGFAIGKDTIQSTGAAKLNIGTSDFNASFGAVSATKQITLNTGINNIVITQVGVKYHANNSFTLKNNTAQSYDWKNVCVANTMNLEYFKSISSTTPSANNYGYQYAMLGTGHIVMDAIVEGGCCDVIDTWKTNNQWIWLSLPLYGNRIVVSTAFTGCGLILPDKHAVLSTLGCGIINNTLDKPFTFRMDFMNTGNTTVCVAGRTKTTIGSTNLDNAALPTVYYNGSIFDAKLNQIEIQPKHILSCMLVYYKQNYCCFLFNGING